MTTAYLTPEARARVRIDEMLGAAGWAVQDARAVNLAASRGVAVREFVLKPPHGRVDYLLYVDGEAVGVVEEKEGETLTGVAWQTAKYLDGLHDEVPSGALEGPPPEVIAHEIVEDLEAALAELSAIGARRSVTSASRTEESQDA